MRAAHRPEQCDECRENCNRSPGVCQQRDRNISASQALRHDAGADHSCRKEHRTHSFGGKAPCKAHELSCVDVLPIESSRACSLMRSSEASGRLVKILMRASSNLK